MKILIPIAASLIALPAAAQQTRTVSNALQFTTELAAAAAGDLILMEPGSYEFDVPYEFRVDKPVRIAARVPGSVHVRSKFGAKIEGIASGELASLDGIDFDLFYHGSGPALAVTSSAGSVFLHDCTFTGVNEEFPLSLAHPGARFENANVAASGCTFTGAYVAQPGHALVPGDGIRAIDTRLELDDCALIGLDGADAEFTPESPATLGGTAMRIEGGQLTAARSLFQAGDGGDGYEFVPGLCLGPAAGGNAIVASGPATTPMEMYGCSVTEGAGGYWPAGCGGAQAASGVAFTGAGYDPAAVFSSATPIGFDAEGTILGGGATIVSVQGLEPFSSKWLLYSRAAQPLDLPGFEGFGVWTAAPLKVLTLPPNGTQALIVPSLSPGAHRGFVLQGLELPADLVPLLHPARFVSIYQ